MSNQIMSNQIMSNQTMSNQIMSNQTMSNQTMSKFIIVLAAALLTAGSAFADSRGEPGRESGKPNPLNNVYFGEQHLHTVNSPDAFAMGVRNTPDDAYRFCKGEAIKKLV